MVLGAPSGVLRGNRPFTHQLSLVSRVQKREGYLEFLLKSHYRFFFFFLSGFDLQSRHPTIITKPSLEWRSKLMIAASLCKVRLHCHLLLVSSLVSHFGHCVTTQVTCCLTHYRHQSQWNEVFNTMCYRLTSCIIWLSHDAHLHHYYLC